MAIDEFFFCLRVLAPDSSIPTTSGASMKMARGSVKPLSAAAFFSWSAGPVRKMDSISEFSGSAPMCYPAKEYLVGDQDVLIGKIGGIPFYISKTQHEAWKNTDLIIDCIKGMGVSKVN